MRKRDKKAERILSDVLNTLNPKQPQAKPERRKPGESIPDMVRRVRRERGLDP